jgi:hypothetical protein
MTSQRRPAGVIFAAIVLGFAAFALLVMAAGSLFGALMIGHVPLNTATAPGMPPPSPAFLTAIIACTAFFYLALAAWAIATIVGLLQMKSWARISVMVIGGGLTLIGITSALATAALPLLLNSVPMPPTANPALLHGIFLVIAAGWLLVAAVGISWLVYFAQRKTRAAFALATTPSTPTPAYAAPPSTILDFSTAQPIDPTPLETWTPPLANVLPPQSTAPKRPISITVLAILFLIGAATALVNIALPFPLFVFGVVIAGWPAHIIVLALALWNGLTGFGLLKLQKPAWFMAVAYCGVGILNSLVLLLPSSRQRMAQYLETLSTSMTMGLPAPQFNVFDPKFFGYLLLPGMVLGFLAVVFILVLLWRARWAFEPQNIAYPSEAAA